MKGLILCAGKGTRLQPSTYTKPKCMLPVNGEYILVSIIDKLVAAGINDIGIVVNSSQGEIRKSIGDGERWNASLTYLLQEEAKGLADAVNSARSFIEDSPFLLMLGDNLYEGEVEPLIRSLESNESAASILLQPVKDPSQFGVAVIENEQIVSLEEKPLKPKSNLAIVGVYVFTGSIWSAIERLTPSRRGEYELTDAIQMIISEGGHVAYNVTTAPFFDIGTHERWLQANRYKMDHDPENFKIPPGMDASVKWIPPVRVHPTARITSSVIGPHVYIGPNSIVEDCILTNSILTDQVHLFHIHAEGSVFGSAVRMEEQEIQEQPARHILGDHASVMRSTPGVHKDSK
ncbi:sugar phosphate nucleotidyltransferase [Paenibacillus sp. P96]|uniref:Glucose-1-phosphate thymidylyltransferase n=1 Tax=Paenibacillus zeirhizosphaerae TaxID=2987519 RepID=A0ABT9FQT4_9BACL|nr:sugar phosphate nucleotidyltransferase [Paenibacillus sp. P96]MDP4097103.1 sugar phosphate nucleotidyltransferase [Paenibacillus sp. P96]